MSQEIQAIGTPFLDAIKKNTGLTIAAGVVMLLMGIFAMASPLVAGASLAVMVGVLLLIGGVSQLVFALKAGSGLFAIILGVLTVIVGGYMVSNPGAALATLTIFLAAYLIVSGIFETVISFQKDPPLTEYSSFTFTIGPYEVQVILCSLPIDHSSPPLGD